MKKLYNRQNQMSPFCKTKRLKNSAHIHTERTPKQRPLLLFYGFSNTI